MVVFCVVVRCRILAYIYVLQEHTASISRAKMGVQKKDYPELQLRKPVFAFTTV